MPPTGTNSSLSVENTLISPDWRPRLKSDGAEAFAPASLLEAANRAEDEST